MRSSVFKVSRTRRRRRVSTGGGIAMGFLGLLAKLNGSAQQLSSARKRLAKS